jgi:serine/threonine protein kinase/tetratricopeptide (TPR) repeat protein
VGKEEKIQQCQKCYTLNSRDSQFCSKCGASLEDIQDTISYGSHEKVPPEKIIYFKPGELFDNRYRIIEEIGRGGMGLVYKAEDTELNITVALKIIHPRHSSNPLFIHRFKKETLIARSISHENVIRIYDLGEANEIKYISMEFIKGQNLRDFIQASGFLAFKTALNLIRQMCEALKAAHQKGIVHQDLKPSNIMVDNSGQLFIMDFGLAKSFYREEKGITKGISGTPRYMSPEQAKGEKIDSRSDIYSFGTIMYEMLTGQPLFKAENTTEYLRMHIEEPPLNPSKINTNIPPQLEKIIIKCLEKDASNRYQYTDEILEDIKKYEEPKAATVKSWMLRHWYVALAPILFLVLLLYSYLWKKSPPPLTLKNKRISMAIVYLTNNTGDKDLDWMGKTLCELLIADLIQSRYIRVMTGDSLYGILNELNLQGVPSYSSDDLQKVASKASVDYILNGNFTRAHETFRINTYLHESTKMDLIGTERVEGQGEGSIFIMVDRLTRKIKEDFDLSAETIAHDIDKDVMQITTNSPEALKHYVEGKRLYEERRFKESIRALEKATELDPDFALAYVKLSEDYYYLLDPDQGDKYLSKALSLLNRVSDREYYLIQAYAAFSPETAIENYQKLLEIYPDDLTGNGYLASMYRNMEEWDLALERFEKIIELDPSDFLSFENIAHIYMAKGLYEKSIRFLKENESLFPDPVPYHERLSIAHLCEGQFVDAAAEIDKALAINSDAPTATQLKGHIHQLQGKFDLAEKNYQQLYQSPELVFQYLGHLWLSHMHLTQGQYERARIEAEKFIDYFERTNFQVGLFNFWLLSVYVNLQKNLLPDALSAASKAHEAALQTDYTDHKNYSLHFRGWVLARMKRFEEAIEEAEKLKQQIEKSGQKKLLRHYHHLMGEISREEGNLQKAIDYFEIAVSLLPKQYQQYDNHILYLDSLASSYYENKEWTKAQKEYEKIASLTTGRLRWGDKYSLSIYMTGKIHQLQGNKEKATERHNRFLEIWKNADSTLKQISDAKRQIALLNSQNPE